VRNCGREAGDVTPRLNFGGWPIHTRKIKTGVLCPAGAGKLAIGNQLAVVALGHKKADFMPVVESLRPSDSDRCLAGITRRRHGILEKDFVDAADRISHRSMGKTGDARNEDEQNGEEGVHESMRGCVRVRHGMRRIRSIGMRSNGVPALFAPA